MSDDLALPLPPDREDVERAIEWLRDNRRTDDADAVAQLGEVFGVLSLVAVGLSEELDDLQEQHVTLLEALAAEGIEVTTIDPTLN